MTPREIAPRVLSWASILDDATAQQAIALAELPFVTPHIALMPDAHFGLGSAVGTVIPTEGAVLPASVGVDIGCGMIAARTRYTAEDLGRIELTELRDQIERAIPLSPGNYNRKVHHGHTRQRVEQLEQQAEREGVDLSHSPKWREQLGSLGGGNHFIELCLDEQDRVWCFLHSGSRGVGNKIAQKHIKIARTESEKGSIALADRDHAYLLEGTPEFDAYLRELHWAQHFALLNREEMMDRFVDQLARLMGDDATEIEVERVNTHHNYTEKVGLAGQEVWLTRKGAINAELGRPGLIPGSMGTRSYVTRGLGNERALYSAPHGAGRTMSRTQAKKRFTAEDLDARMSGIVYRPGKQWVDEIPDAYKPIDQVMEDAADLVEIVHELRQVLNVKGT
ncbi:RtcB family protein [Corynebacterium halotolerans]|uniref:RtcB family protein n=1 Tax=Corynebacterium halotolerans TaxID=225326 RepID=UPI003CF6DE3E